jgi:hypothetical protein
LSKSEEQLDKVLEVGRSATMSVVDLPTVLLRGGQHVEVILRVAILVDPRDGRCYTLGWVLDKIGNDDYRLAEGPLVLFKPNLVMTCDLDVDKSRFFLGTPSPDAFAVMRLPDGTPLAMPAEARTYAALRRFTPQSVFGLETALWKAVFPERK